MYREGNLKGRPLSKTWIPPKAEQRADLEQPNHVLGRGSGRGAESERESGGMWEGGRGAERFPHNGT
jgi:hypothetical protein